MVHRVEQSAVCLSLNTSKRLKLFESLSATNTVQCLCGVFLWFWRRLQLFSSELLIYLFSWHYVALQVRRQVPSASRTVGGPWRKPALADYRSRRRLTEWRNSVRWSVKETSTRRSAALCHRPCLSRHTTQRLRTALREWTTRSSWTWKHLNQGQMVLSATI